MKCRNCKKKISKFAKQCPYCRATVKIEEALKREYEEYIENVTDAATKESEEEVTPKRKKLIPKSIVALVCAMAAMLICISSEKWRGKEQKFDRGLIYYLDDNVLSVKSLESGRTKVLSPQISQTLNGKDAAKVEESVYYEDQKRSVVYYATEIYDRPMVSYHLYVQDTKNLMSNPKLIGENVRMQTIDGEGNLYYVTTDTACLYQYNGETVKKIELPYVEQLLYEAETDTLLAITKRTDAIKVKSDLSYDSPLNTNWSESNANVDIILIDCKKLKPRTKVEQYEGKVSITSRHDKVYYEKNNQLYVLDVVRDKVDKLRENVTDFDITSQDELYYVSYELQERSYYDFVKDPYKEQDEKNPPLKAAKKRSDIRQQLKTKKVMVFEGTLRVLRGEEDEIVEKNVIEIYRNKEKQQEKIHFSYGEENVKVATMTERKPEEVVNRLEKYFYNPVANQGTVHGWTSYLYDYLDTSLAIPQIEKVNCFAKEGVYQYDCSKNKIELVPKKSN